MLKFKVSVQDGKDGVITQHVIQAKDLTDAELVANKKFNKTRLHWIDIIYCDLKNSKLAN